MNILSIHTQGHVEIGAEPAETIRNSNLPWFKAMDPDTWGAPPNETVPGKRIFARLHGGGTGWDHVEHEYMRRGAQGAEEYFALMWPKMEKSMAGGVLDFEGPNEPHPNHTDNPIPVFVEFWQRWAELVVEVGARPWVLSLGVGWMPDADDIVAFKSVIEYAAANDGGLAVHEYYAGPGPNANLGEWIGRIRLSLNALYEAGTEPMSVPVIISECGLTWALNGKEDVGFRANNTYVFPSLGEGDPTGIMSEEKYMYHLRWIEGYYLTVVPEVVMMTVFTTLPLGNLWTTFDVNTGMVAEICAPYSYVEDIEEAIGEIMQDYIIPLNPDAALEKAGATLGYLPASDEVWIDINGETYVSQAFRNPGEEETQHIAYCILGDWDSITWFERIN